MNINNYHIYKLFMLYNIAFEILKKLKYILGDKVQSYFKKHSMFLKT